MSTEGDMMRPARRTNSVGVQADDTRICVVMVGLPARGKSYIAQKRKATLFPPHNSCVLALLLGSFFRRPKTDESN